MPFRPAPLLLILLVAACGAGNDPVDGGTPRSDGGPDAGSQADAAVVDSGAIAPVNGDPLDPMTRAAELATAICAHRDRCEPIYRSYLPETQLQCESREAASLRAEWTPYLPLIGAHRVAFIASEFDRCIAAYQSALNDCDLGPTPRACDGIFLGSRPTVAACGHSIECVAEHWCTAVPLACGLCVPKAQAGGDCTSTPCASGTECVQIGGPNRVCVPNTAALGEACGSSETGLCRGQLQCVGPVGGAPRCARPVGLGLQCQSDGSAPNCSLLAGLACDDTQLCAPVTVVAPPTPCGSAHPTSLCNSASACRTATGQCQALAALGEVCNDLSPCGAGLRCHPDVAGGSAGHCQAILASGASCTDDRECSDTERCITRHCGPLLIDASCG